MPDFGNTAVFSQVDANNNTGTMPSWLGTAAPSTLDDAGRALQGAVTREWNWRNFTVTAGGTADAKTLTYSVAPAALYNGQRFAFIANTTNTGAVTLNINTLGAKAVRKVFTGTPAALVAGDMISGMRVEVAYNQAADAFDWVNQMAPIVGYSSGGASVTQLTSKSTAVTANALSGRITTAADSLAGNTTVVFTVNNSNVAATDIILVHRAITGLGSTYLVWCDGLGSGFFNVCIRNLTGSTATESITINFAIIKAVNA